MPLMAATGPLRAWVYFVRVTPPAFMTSSKVPGFRGTVTFTQKTPLRVLAARPFTVTGVPSSTVLRYASLTVPQASRLLPMMTEGGMKWASMPAGSPGSSWRSAEASTVVGVRTCTK